MEKVLRIIDFILWLCRFIKELLTYKDYDNENK